MGWITPNVCSVPVLAWCPPDRNRPVTPGVRSRLRTFKGDAQAHRTRSRRSGALTGYPDRTRLPRRSRVPDQSPAAVLRRWLRAPRLVLVRETAAPAEPVRPPVASPPFDRSRPTSRRSAGRRAIGPLHPVPPPPAEVGGGAHGRRRAAADLSARSDAHGRRGEKGAAPPSGLTWQRQGSRRGRAVRHDHPAPRVGPAEPAFVTAGCPDRRQRGPSDHRRRQNRILRTPARQSRSRPPASGGTGVPDRGPAEPVPDRGQRRGTRAAITRDVVTCPQRRWPATRTGSRPRASGVGVRPALSAPPAERCPAGSPPRSRCPA
jgi:hypothetical protein